MTLYDSAVIITHVLKTILWTLAACSVSVNLVAASGDFTAASLDVNGTKHYYFVFAPKSLSTAPAPMLLLLHGSGRDGRSLLDPWKTLAEREGIILVAPNAMNAAGWQNPIDGPEALISIADEVQKQYTVDKTRVYLFGHSAGAVFALLMPLWQPRYFAAVSIHAGAIPRESESLANDAAHAVKRRTPIQIQVGVDDQFFSVQNVRRSCDLLTTNGFTVELSEIPKHDHNYYSIAGNVNLKAWEFLKDRTNESK